MEAMVKVERALEETPAVAKVGAKLEVARAGVEEPAQK